MIVGGLAELLLRSTLLLGIIWLSAEAVRRRDASAAMRHMIWIFGFAGLALLPVLATVLPVLPVPVLPAEAAVTSVAPDGPIAPLPLQETGPSAETILQLLYFGVAFGIFGRLIAGRLILARIWMRARDLADRKRLRLLDELSSALRVSARAEVRISSGAIVPMTWGTFRPRILLPAAAVDWSDEQWRVVLLHELGHVVRRDSAGRTAAAMICAFYWANPIVWIAAERMRREQEHACDDLVLSNGAEASVYARNLLVAARSLHSCGSTCAAAMISRPDLECRLLAIVGDVSRRRAGRGFVSVGAIMSLATVSFAAAVLPVAATPAAPVPLRMVQKAQAPTEVAEPAPIATSVVAESAPAAIRHATLPGTNPSIPIVEAVAAVEADPATDYERALAAYREQKSQYLTELDTYHVKVAAYRAAMAQHRRDMAQYQQLVEAIRALPEGDPNKIVPPAPVSPVAPVAPVVPVVPPVPPDLHHS